MRLALFGVALVMAAAEGRSRRGNGARGSRDEKSGSSDTERFMAWAAKQGKSFTNTKEFTDRLSIWNETDKMIQETNAKAEASGDKMALKLKHNLFSDWTTEEREKLFGLKDADTRREGVKSDKGEGDRGKGLGHTASQVDWAANGTTGPVKDQGQCGSCYTFASNTVLEATVTIQLGLEYKRISEQQIVDCANWDETNYYYLYGCNGGYMTETWWYQRDHGVMLDADYPYKAYEQDCMYDQSKVKEVVDISYWESYWHGDNAMGLAEWLTEGPVAIAVAASPDAFMFYDSGLVTSENCTGNLNHAVVVVGYQPGNLTQTVRGARSPNKVKQETITEVECRQRRWRDHFYETGCMHSDEYLESNDYCCWEITMVIDDGDDDCDPDDDDTDPVDPDDGNDDEDDYEGPAYWKIQNSWGTWWGDEGFIYLAFEEGDGACGMNLWNDRVFLN